MFPKAGVTGLPHLSLDGQMSELLLWNAVDGYLLLARWPHMMSALGQHLCLFYYYW